MTKEELAELKKHKKIYIKKSQNVKLFLHNTFKNTFLKKMCTFKDIEILHKLYDKVGKKLEADLNIVKLIKHIRDVKILSN